MHLMVDNLVYVIYHHTSDCKRIIGASLSKPHASPTNGAIFIYYYYYYISVVRIPYVCLDCNFNATVCCMRSISNIFALQTQTFQHDREQQNEHSFTMGEDSKERDAWEE